MFVRPKQGFVSSLPGFPDVVIEMKDILTDTNPHVRARPDMFEPIRATIGDGPGGTFVEEATARPGERRAR